MFSPMVDCSDTSSSSGGSSSGPRTPSRAASPQIKIADMSSLILHSPNDQIVGTPFATNCGNAPFEYPFPMSTSPISASSSLGQACPTPAMGPASSNSSRPPSPGIPLPPPAFAHSGVLSDPTSTIALSLSMGVPVPSSSDSNGAATTHHTHPHKMRMASAPVPPGLIKRRKERAGTANGVINGSTGSASSSRRGSNGSTGHVKPQRPLMADTGLRLSNS